MKEKKLANFLLTKSDIKLLNKVPRDLSANLNGGDQWVHSLYKVSALNLSINQSPYTQFHLQI